MGVMRTDDPIEKPMSQEDLIRFQQRLAGVMERLPDIFKPRPTSVNEQSAQEELDRDFHTA